MCLCRNTTPVVLSAFRDKKIISPCLDLIIVSRSNVCAPSKFDVFTFGDITSMRSSFIILQSGAYNAKGTLVG